MYRYRVSKMDGQKIVIWRRVWRMYVCMHVCTLLKPSTHPDPLIHSSGLRPPFYLGVKIPQQHLSRDAEKPATHAYEPPDQVRAVRARRPARRADREGGADVRQRARRRVGRALRARRARAGRAPAPYDHRAPPAGREERGDPHLFATIDAFFEARPPARDVNGCPNVILTHPWGCMTSRARTPAG